MKKLFPIILVLFLVWGGSAFTATIECISKNGEKETFTYNNEIIVSKAKSFSDVMFDGKSFTGRAYDYQRNILLIKNISTQWKILINTELNYVLISKYDLKKDETIDWIYKDCK